MRPKKVARARDGEERGGAGLGLLPPHGRGLGPLAGRSGFGNPAEHRAHAVYGWFLTTNEETEVYVT